jgi:hypothetical protein
MPAQASTLDTEEPVIVAGTHSGYPGVVVTIEEIDEPTAQQWMLANNKNRKVKTRHRDGIVRDMLAGAWVLDGSPVCFDTDGDLIDGQHRLEGIIRYYVAERRAGNIPVPKVTVVVRGLPLAARTVKDTNAPRSGGDAAAIADYPNAYLLSALAKQAHIWVNTNEGMAGTSSTKVTNSETLAMIEAHPEFHDMVTFTNTMAKKNKATVPGLTAGVGAFALWLFSYRDADTGLTFMRSIWSGAGLDEGSPGLVFRDRLATAKKNNEPLQPLDVLMFLLMAWNKYQERQPLTRLQRPRGLHGPGSGHFSTRSLREISVHHAPPRRGEKDPAQASRPAVMALPAR